MGAEKVRQVALGELHADPALSDLLPQLSGEEREVLHESIVVEGVREPLVCRRVEERLVVVDGYARLDVVRALSLATVPIREQVFKDNEQVRTWLRLQHLGRRNLSTPARCALAVDLLPAARRKAKERQRKAGQLFGRGSNLKKLSQTVGKAKVGGARKEVGKKVGTSDETIRQYEYVLSSGHDDLIKKMRSEQITISAAYRYSQRRKNKDARRIQVIKDGEEAAKKLSPNDYRPEWLLGDGLHHLQEYIKQGGKKGRLVCTDVPFGTGDHDDCANDETPRKARDVVEPVLRLVSDALTDDAHLLVFASWRSFSWTLQVIEEAGYKVQNTLVWDKPGLGVGGHGRTWRDGFELIIHSTKGDPPIHKASSEHNVLSYKRHPYQHGRFHTCQKPVALLQYLIERTTVPGDLVLDPFGGTGSTIVAAIESGRRAWGSELMPKHHEIGEARINEALAAKDGGEAA